MNKQQTPLNTTFMPKAVQLAKDADKSAPSAWLSDYRQAQVALLEQATFPHKQVEHFKYNRLHGFDDCDFNELASLDETSGSIDLSQYDIGKLADGTNVERLVFINGCLSLEKSHLSQHKITSLANSNEAQQQKILAMLNTQELSKNIFSLYNGMLTAVDNNAVFIEIDENSPNALIEIISINSNESANQSANSQVFMDIADRCKATIVSRFISATDSMPTLLSTQRIMINVGESASCQHYNLALENSHSLNFANICYNLQSHSTLNAFHAVTGGKLKKLDIEANHLGQHAHATLNGLYVATDDEQVDVHSEVNHPKPHGTTDENFRGLVNGNAEAVFNGRIHIFKDAQKTLAEMSNKNLVLSDTALLHTKPELEIYADDVICAHGATVSRLQDSAINYLRARGISKSEAELMLSYAFFDELLAELDHEAIAAYIRPILFSTVAVAKA